MATQRIGSATRPSPFHSSSHRTFDSDIDLLLTGGAKGGPDLLERLGARLRAAPWVESVRVLSHARVPIATLQTTNRISVVQMLVSTQRPRGLVDHGHRPHRKNAAA